jgi:Site-specific recombinases, DNA invertase Pin homologs
MVAGMSSDRNIKLIAPQERDENIIRVAAYCRVSSNSCDQLESYTKQVNFYTEYIGEQPNWVLVDIYADEGITGTSAEKRDDFNRLLADCKKGKIDRILVKSVSRFARNTYECLVYARMFKEAGATVYFEKEDIDTASMKDEVYLTMHGMMAQHESISLSGNMRMSYKWRMENGEFNCCRAPFGFVLKEGELHIIEEEAQVIRRIFGMYLSGLGKQRIADTLNEEKIPKRYSSSTGWTAAGVDYILRNERYIGDALLQKKFTRDELPFIRIRNNGEKERYYVENSNPQIVGREVFDVAQNLIRKKTTQNDSWNPHILNKKLICPQCGHFFRRHKLNDKYRWLCAYRAKGNTNCCKIQILEQSIQDAYIMLINKLAQNRKYIIVPLIGHLSQMQLRSGGNGNQIYKIDKEIADLNSENHVISRLHTNGVLDTVEYSSKSAGINEKVSNLRRKKRLLIANDENELVIDELRSLDEILENISGVITCFDENLFTETVESIDVLSQNELSFNLIGSVRFIEEI